VSAEQLASDLGDGNITEIEVAWSDPYGRVQGKRVPAGHYDGPAAGKGFGFCDGSLVWNAAGEVQEDIGDPTSTPPPTPTPTADFPGGPASVR